MVPVSFDNDNLVLMRDIAPHTSEGTKRWVENTNELVEQNMAPRVGPGLTIAAAINVVVVVVTKRGIDGAKALAKDPYDAWHNAKTPAREQHRRYGDAACDVAARLRPRSELPEQRR